MAPSEPLAPIPDDTVLYRDSRRLSARLLLHERFSTSTRKWFSWVFDHLQLPEGSHILELGTGTGALWSRNLYRLPASWQATLSDLSVGMLHDAARTLGPAARRFRWLVANADAIPFASESFDCVIANHMLYHVVSPEATLAEIRQILKPGGFLFTSTNGPQHMQEMWDLVARFDPEIITPGDNPNKRLRFSLDNGAALLSKSFPETVLHRYDSTLVVREAEPLIGHVLSTNRARPLATDPTRLSRFNAYVESKLSAESAIRITTDSGLFVAHRG